LLKRSFGKIVASSKGGEALRIFFVSDYRHWGSFLPTDLRNPSADRQIGGGETAMISLARQLASGLGHEVIVFHDVEAPGRYDEVDYLPKAAFQALATSMEHDVLVSWDWPEALDGPTRSHRRVLAFQLNDARIGAAAARIDAYFHPSQWHADRFAAMYPEIDRAKQRARMTNAVDLARYQQAVERDPFRVVYSSSPDRGLHHLLRIWPEVQRREPRASLHVFYELDRWMRGNLAPPPAGPEYFVAQESHRRARAVLEALERCRGLNVHLHGAVGQWQLAAEHLRSSVMAYPCDPMLPTEGFSMSCLEALTAGCRLIVSAADALPELWGDRPGTELLPLPIHDETWIDAITRAVRSPPAPSGLSYLASEDWHPLSCRWDQELTALFAAETPGSSRRCARGAVAQVARKVSGGKEFRFVFNENYASWWSFHTEQEVRDAFWRIEAGEVVFDVGAAWGSYCLPALAAGATVWAWSPDMEAPLLRQSVGINEFSGRCRILETGLYSRRGYLDANSLRFSEQPEPGLMAVETLDEVVAKEPPARLDWIKIDVEGAELEVLRGAEATLRRYRPKLLIENHVFKVPTIEADIRAYLGSLGMGYRESGPVEYGGCTHSLFVAGG
jgi:FkbM family methyltransferase